MHLLRIALLPPVIFHQPATILPHGHLNVGAGWCGGATHSSLRDGDGWLAVNLIRAIEGISWDPEHGGMNAGETASTTRFLPVRTRGGADMKTYTVYRVDYRTNKHELIGKLVERRMKERKNNAADMLRLAQKMYATSSIDTSIFIKDSSSGGRLFGGA